jgi:cell division septation protein DedD
LGGIVPTEPVGQTAETPKPETDAIETSSVSQPTSPELLEGSIKTANADEPSAGVTQTTVSIETRRIKTITDRVPVEEDKPAGVQPAAIEEPDEKVVAVEVVPPDPEASEPAVEAAAAPEPAATPEPAPEPAAEAAAEPSDDAPLSGWAVQISSQKDERVAWKVWKRLKAKHKILADQKAVVMKADLGDRGVVYRLRLAGFEDQNSARGMCSKLKSRGVSCYVSKISS